ncbi:MAG: glutamate--tRNA ligase [Candidatus Paracaedibacteraceae bacterium]|nr:glutamate--tRNA ligase [Candidatus Paracaedibacteraceae bacterium]
MTIRVRFAPSPTGLLHIGNARTALINWLFFRSHQLKGHEAHFLLRQDDTDLERSKEDYAEAIKQDLAWLGITYDTFMKQSDRFTRYDEMKQKLIDEGRLYPCYETPEELDFKRKRQMSRGEPPLYDQAALKLTEEEKAAFEKEGRRPHWRFKLLPEEIKWQDLIRGENQFHGAHLSDPVLVRADGAYLYTLTSVVDDIDTEITHILRGEDHVTNTAVQIQIFEALGRKATTIHFSHTTLLKDVDGSPLSKRLGSLSLRNLREQGIEPMAINCLLARLGTSQPVELHPTMDELARGFDLATFSRTPPRFDMHDLETLNRKIYQVYPYDALSSKLKELGAPDITPTIWNLVRENLKNLDELAQWQQVFFGEIQSTVEDKGYLQTALKLLPSTPWTTETWSHWTTAIKAETGRKGRDLFMPLRQALTGFDHGPEMKELLPLIGYEAAVKRLSI